MLRKTAICCVLFVSTFVLCAASAFAGGGVRVGIGIGVPLYPHYYYPHYYYPYPYYAAPAPVYVVPPPGYGYVQPAPVYVQPNGGYTQPPPVVQQNYQAAPAVQTYAPANSAQQPGLLSPPSASSVPPAPAPAGS
jgi:hypothetical protein